MKKNKILKVKCINPTKTLIKNKVYRVEVKKCFYGNHAGLEGYRDYYLLEFSKGRFINVSPKRFKIIK